MFLSLVPTTIKLWT